MGLKDAREAAAGLDRFLKTARGFRSRSTYFSRESKRWCDVLLWKDLESALAAAKAIEAHPAYRRFARLVDEKSIDLAHYEKVP